MEILIVKTSAIGDVTHTLPALNALRKKYPQARITWLVEEAAADVVIGHAALDHVLVSRRKKWTRELLGPGFFKTFQKIISFVRELRAIRYDLLIDFQGLLKSGILVGLARAERKVGFGRGMDHAEGSYIFLNEKIPAVDMDIHALDREMMLLKAIGVESEKIEFGFPIGVKDRSVIVSKLLENGIDSDASVAAINPPATWPTKLWDNDKFAEVAQNLLDKGFKVVFTGGPTDRTAIDDMINKHQLQAVNFAGETTLKELAALYERAELLVTTDTGPMHIAAAVGTPVVAIFGPTAPWRTGPYGKGHQIVRAEIDCSPCLKKECATKECMHVIDADRILGAVHKIIADKGSDAVHTEL